MVVNQQALGKLQSAIERLIDKYPLHAAILKRMQIRKRADIKTMAVSIGGSPNDTWGEEGRVVNFWYCEEFILDTPLIELTGVCLHEVHHVLFGHITTNQKDYPHKAARIAAEELTVNEYIKEPLPKTDFLLKNFPDLPPFESTYDRYERLKKTIPETKVTISMDDHGIWAEVEGAASEEEAQEITQQAIRKLIEDAIEDVKEGKEIDLPDEIIETIKNHDKYGQGYGHTIETLVRAPKYEINWQQKLAKYVGSALEIRPRYNRPNRRFPDLVGIVPGKGRLANKPKIMAQLDTSGSITEEMLGRMNATISQLAKNYEVTVVEFGDYVYRTYPYTKPITDVWGRAGNRGAPGLEKEFLTKHRPDLVMIFTDGHLCVPMDHPTLVKQPSIGGKRLPVLWCIQPNGEKPVAWGEIIYMR